MHTPVMFNTIQSSSVRDVFQRAKNFKNEIIGLLKPIKLY